jgi:outer membrane protein OmpA-like peptidoglycan-associated protein
MEPRNSIFVPLILLCLLAGCSAKRDLIILLPDPDGKVGAIRVTTRGGSQILDKSGYAVEVEDFNKPPIAPRPIAEGEITGVFGAALSAQPDLTGRFISFLLFFESDTSELIHESKNLLPEIVRTIQNRKRNEIYLVGHTDRVGTDLYNIKLSSRRAYYVRDLLVSSGVKSSDIDVSFHGETMPIVYTEDEVAEPLNRRVEVIAR